MNGTSLFSDVTLQSDLLTQTTRHTAAGRNSAARPVVFLIRFPLQTKEPHSSCETEGVTCKCDSAASLCISQAIFCHIAPFVLVRKRPGVGETLFNPAASDVLHKPAL